MLTGTIKFFNAEKGYGFVIPNDGGGDVYLHWRSCGNYVPEKGDIVQFEIKEFEAGRKAAWNVNLAE